jgi:hypothetical protein
LIWQDCCPKTGGHFSEILLRPGNQSGPNAFFEPRFVTDVRLFLMETLVL